MKIQFWSIGKPHEPYVKTGVDQFTKRITHYYPVEWFLIPSPKNKVMLSEMDLRKKEGETVLGFLQKEDFLVLLDENGNLIHTEELSRLIEKRANHSTRKLVFLIGGAFGVSEAIKQRANYKWSLSPLVFPHQLARLILAEQVYRACTILRNEKYHHS